MTCFSRLSRRLFACCVILILIGLSPGRGVASATDNNPTTEPSAIWLTWAGDPCTTMVIAWLTDNDTHIADDLAYHASDAPNTSWTVMNATTHPMPGNAYIIHTARLSNLTPDTDYTFRLKEAGKFHRFRTMPMHLDRPVKMVDEGDLENDMHLLLPLCEQVGRADPDFIVLGGDIAYASGHPENAKRWVDLLTLFTQKFVSPDGRLIPIVPVIGNHEVANGGYDRTNDDAPFFYSLFAYPGDRGYGVLDFGDYLSLITLDSGHTHPVEGEQSAWLERTLASRQDIPNLAVSYHVPAWPSARPFNLSISEQIRSSWVPLFESFHVDACYEHHDHAYKRTYPIRNGKADPHGVLYFGDGGCSEPKGRIPKPPGSMLTGGRWYLAESGSVNHFHLLTIVGNTRLHQAIDMNGQLFDQIMVTDGAPIMMLNVPYAVTWWQLTTLLLAVLLIAIVTPKLIKRIRHAVLRKPPAPVSA